MVDAPTLPAEFSTWAQNNDNDSYILHSQTLRQLIDLSREIYMGGHPWRLNYGPDVYDGYLRNEYIDYIDFLRSRYFPSNTVGPSSADVEITNMPTNIKLLLYIKQKQTVMRRSMYWFFNK